MKTYCECKKQDYVTRQVSDQLTFKNDFLWVCATCCLPHKLVWLGYIRPCRGCLNPRCLPWAEFCQACFKIEYPEDAKYYYGLLKARREAMKKLTWPLPKTEYERVLGSKPLRGKGFESLGDHLKIPKVAKLNDTI